MGKEANVHLNQAQNALYFRIADAKGIQSDFEVLCAKFEAALDEADEPPDLEKTDPYGVVSILSAADRPQIQTAEAATIIAVAWLEMVAAAITDQDGDASALIFDEDGVAVFTDTRPLFEAAQSCGFGPAHARRAFARVRKDGADARRRSMRILGTVGAIKVAKRKSKFRRTSRISRLDPCFADQLDRGEIARAKAGSIFYSLIVLKDGYGAVRSRRKRLKPITDEGGEALDVLDEIDTDLMDGFDVPLMPCEELHGTALDHFIQFLDEANDRKSRNTYQRLVHRALAA